jgi:protein gp37
MSELTNISWTDSTHNPWSGCAKISAGCANCYAANLPPAMRRHAVWGPTGTRVRASESYLRQPFAWDAKAQRAGVRHRVFCASVADVFEDRADLDPWREDLWETIKATPWLDWQLLTKRPHVAARWAESHPWPVNAWIGTSVEDQAAADERIPHLLRVPARVRFLSCEPLIGAVDLDKLWCHNCETDEHVRFDPPAQPWCIECDSEVGGAEWLDACADQRQRGVSWVITGGESGRNARPMSPGWALDIIRQCQAANVPVFHKQMGSAWAPAHNVFDSKGGNPSEWPEAFWVREFPALEATNG